jgi:hypothetical protein
MLRQVITADCDHCVWAPGIHDDRPFRKRPSRRTFNVTSSTDGIAIKVSAASPRTDRLFDAPASVAVIDESMIAHEPLTCRFPGA